ncbi:hypothetical protein [Paenibacillus chitinolyticus]|uniref:hypothetical protein n=1 Tax=Paenibacillus chitinolyticus TaxID=79263 RepID=UPI003D031B87
MSGKPCLRNDAGRFETCRAQYLEKMYDISINTINLNEVNVVTERSNLNLKREKNPWSLTIRLLNILLILVIAGIALYVGLWLITLLGINI